MIQKMNKKILSALIGLSCSFTASNSFAEDLLQVFEIATANDPTVLKAKANADRDAYNIDSAMSSLLPNLSFSTGYDKSHSFGGKLTLSQSLFDFSNWKSLSIAEKEALQSKTSYDLAQQTLIVRVSNAYFDVLGNMDDLEFVQAEKRAIERQLEQTKQRFAVGLTAITDVHEAQAQFDNAVAREIVAKNDVETSREQLREITGKYHSKLNPLNTTRFSTVSPTNNSEDFIKTAEERNLELQISKLSVEVAKVRIERAKAGHLPTLSLNGSYSESWDSRPANADGIRAPKDSTTLGVSLTAPIYAGGGIQAGVDIARFNYVASSEDLEATHRSVTRNVRTSYNQVVSDIATYKALEQAVVSAQSALQATEAGFEVGTRTIVDVLLSTRNLFDAKRNLSAVRYRYVVSTLSLKQAAGTLNKTDIEAINRGLN